MTTKFNPNLPDEINDAISLLKKSENEDNIGVKIKLFTEGVEELSACVSEFPNHQNVINRLKFAYARSMVNFLKNNKPDVDADSWFVLIFDFILKEKEIFKKIIIEGPEVKSYFEQEFLPLWAEVEPSNLKGALDSLFKDQTNQVPNIR